MVNVVKHYNSLVKPCTSPSLISRALHHVIAHASFFFFTGRLVVRQCLELLLAVAHQLVAGHVALAVAELGEAVVTCGL